MGTRPAKTPKPPETIGLEAQEGGGFTLRVPGWLSKKAVTALGAALAAAASGAWIGVQKVGSADERFEAWAQAQASVASTQAEADRVGRDAILDRLDRLEAASLARMDRIEATHAQLAHDVAFNSRSVERLERRADRGTRTR